MLYIYSQNEDLEKMIYLLPESHNRGTSSIENPEARPKTKPG